MNAPLLSICIPTFNNSKVLSQNINQLLSHLKGFADNIEIIVSENFSSSFESQKILQLQSKTVKVFNNSQNLGFGKNLLMSLSLARGTYLMLLGDDDFVDENLINDVIEYLSITDSKKLICLPLSTDNPTNPPYNFISRIVYQTNDGPCFS